MRGRLAPPSVVSSGNRMNRRGGVSLDLAAERFMAGILASHAPSAFGRRSQMCTRSVSEVGAHGAGADGRGPWSDAELLVDQPRDLGAVGPALGLAHHIPDDRTDRLGVPFADALGRVGIRAQ